MEDTVIFSAGKQVPPGEYVRIDIWSDRVIDIALNDFLPASHDGRIAMYRQLPIKHGVAAVSNTLQTVIPRRVTETPAMRRSA